MGIIFALVGKFPIVAVVFGLLLSAAFGKIVKENLERGIKFNGLAAFLLCANLALLGLASTFTCATSATFCLPGLHRNDALTGMLAGFGFYAILGGFFIVPVSAIVLITYAFGWVYWILGGCKHYPSVKS